MQDNGFHPHSNVWKLCFLLTLHIGIIAENYIRGFLCFKIGPWQNSWGLVTVSIWWLCLCHHCLCMLRFFSCGVRFKQVCFSSGKMIRKNPKCHLHLNSVIWCDRMSCTTSQTHSPLTKVEAISKEKSRFIYKDMSPCSDVKNGWHWPWNTQSAFLWQILPWGLPLKLPRISQPTFNYWLREFCILCLKYKLSVCFGPQVEKELRSICNDILDVLDKHLILAAVTGESKVFYYKMYVSNKHGYMSVTQNVFISILTSGARTVWFY